MPKTKALGLNEGDECIAITSPVNMSIIQIDPALSANSSFVSF